MPGPPNGKLHLRNDHVVAGWELIHGHGDRIVRDMLKALEGHPDAGYVLHSGQYKLELTLVEFNPNAQPVRRTAAEVSARMHRHATGRLPSDGPDDYPQSARLHPDCNEALKGVPPKCECGADKVGGRHSKWCPLYEEISP